MTLSDSLAFVDVETVGLDLEHDIWEIAVAIGDGPVECYQVPHSLTNADRMALELNGYWRRFDSNRVFREADLKFKDMLTGKTLVGANPSFDAYRLQRRWGAQVWHYRMMDVESMAAVLFNLAQPPGLASIVTELGNMDYTLPSNDHTAAQDVLTVREVYKILQQIGSERYEAATASASP